MAKPSITDASRRAQDAAEADAISALVTLEGKGCNLRLVSPSAKLAKADRRSVYLALGLIALGLTDTQTLGRDPVWRAYQHHFVGDEKRAKFFRRLRSHTRQVTADYLTLFGSSKDDFKDGVGRPVQWDSSLLPASVARFVLYLAILHPGVLEHFLPRFFTQVSDASLYGSTYRRSLLILIAVPQLGWSARKHTNMLREVGLLRPGNRRTQEQTIKKFIARLRKKKRDIEKFLSG